MTQTSLLILGKGYLGAPLAAHLRAAGHCVAATRRTADDDLTQAFALDDFDPRAAAVQSWRDHAVWVCLLPPSAGANYVEHLHALLDYAEQCGVRRMVYAGSISVYGSAARLCHEDTPCAPESEAACKILAVENLLRSSRLPEIRIVRLGGLYDDARHPIHSLAGRKMLRGGRHPVNLTPRTDAVQALTAAALQSDNVLLRNVVAAAHPLRQDFYPAEARRFRLPEPHFDPHDLSSGKIVISRF
ncbi:MAG: NAD(P)H-binding protein [Neisseria sp.]|nr:NAD(P)H-binding protein [Neisseria sp.]